MTARLHWYLDPYSPHQLKKQRQSWTPSNKASWIRACLRIRKLSISVSQFILSRTLKAKIHVGGILNSNLSEILSISQISKRLAIFENLSKMYLNLEIISNRKFRVKLNSNGKKEGKDQEMIQSNTTPGPGYQWESDNVTIRHQKRELRGQPFPNR